MWWIGVSTFFLIWTNHFDDYPQLDLEIMGNASQETAEALFDLVGWKVSYDEAKRQPFKSEFAPLGVVINLAESGVGKIVVKNKASRLESIVKECHSIVDADELHPPCARSLLGRVAFCESQCFNRLGAVAVKDIAARSRDQQVTKPLPHTLKEKLLWLAGALGNMRPKIVDCFADRRPIILFTDGAAESSDPAVLTFDLVTVGAVAIDTADGSIKYFGDHVPDELINEWRSGGILQVITQAEVYPVALSKTLMGDA